VSYKDYSYFAFIVFVVGTSLPAVKTSVITDYALHNTIAWVKGNLFSYTFLVLILMVMVQEIKICS